MSKWISRPSEILYRTTFNNIPSRASRPIFAQAQAQAFRRTLTTTPSARLKRPTPSTLFPKQRLNRRYNSGSSNGSGSENANGQAGRTEKASLSERLKKLSREYGWAALGVYLALSALDFPFCFAAVRLLGVERIGHYEHVVVQFVKDKFKAVWPTSDESDGQGKLVEAEERNKDEASKFWRMRDVLLNLDMKSILTIFDGRHLDTVGVCVCDSQELHFHSSAFDGGCVAQGCEDTTGMGMEYWQEEA